MRIYILSILTAAVGALPQPVTHRSHTFTIRADVPLRARANRLIPVVVGGAQDLFVPNLVVATVGDVLQFQFSSGNHTVTQSDEHAGCQPLQATVPGAIHSGHIPFEAGQTTVGTFNMPVTTSDPIFLYCATGPHCQTGQVMVVNPTSEEQLLNYVEVSAAAAENVDGNEVSGGTVGEIPLEAAAFTPPAEEEAAPAGAAAEAVEAPPAEAQPANATTPDAASAEAVTTEAA